MMTKEEFQQLQEVKCAKLYGVGSPIYNELVEECRKWLSKIKDKRWDESEKYLRKYRIEA